MNGEHSPGNKSPLDDQVTQNIAQVAAQVAGQAAAQAVTQLATQLAQQQTQVMQSNHQAILREMDKITADHRADLLRVETAVRDSLIGLSASLTGVNIKVDLHDKEDDRRFAAHSKTINIGIGIVTLLVFLIGAWQFVAKLFQH